MSKFKLFKLSILEYIEQHLAKEFQSYLTKKYCIVLLACALGSNAYALSDAEYDCYQACKSTEKSNYSIGYDFNEERGCKCLFDDEASNDDLTTEERESYNKSIVTEIERQDSITELNDNHIYLTDLAGFNSEKEEDKTNESN